MKFKKKFQNIGGTKGVIIPKEWYTELSEKYPDKKLIGVHMHVNDEEIQLIPMWEEDDDVSR